MRPLLNKEITVEDFLNYYWLKEELQQFCRTYGLSSSGSKVEITSSIQLFLQTGQITKPKRKRVKKSPPLKVACSLETIIKEGHTCSQHVRAFFQSHIPNFHFSTYIQNFFKENIGKTYQDVIDAWYEEQARVKDASYKKKIAPQFQYNQFTRDFFADPHNKGKHRDEAIAAWKRVKAQPGDHKYRPE